MELTSGQQALQNEVRNFVDQEIMPFASEYNQKQSFPVELIRKLS